MRQDVPGGILADDMGVGKTLTCLAVVVHDKLRSRSADAEAGECESDAAENEVDVVEPETSNDSTTIAEVSRIPSVSTLVVAPKTALPQWKDNVETHVLPGALSVRV
ncbi:SNF2 family domain-containing protein [Aphelenchoides avenae]|nr:SNF2 family domain-containing protein [Aphelenchus avenae]